MIQNRLLSSNFISRRHGFGFRRRVIAVAVLFSVCAGLALFFGHKGNNSDILFVQESPAVSLQPNIIERRVADSSSENDLPGKPQVASLAHVSLVESIQTNIASMLEAGARMTVSEKKVIVGRGDTLMSLLMKKASVPREEAYQVVQALGKSYNLRGINPGREITVFFHKDPSVADPKFSGVRIEKDPLNDVTVKRSKDGRYTVKTEEKSTRRTLRAFQGIIDNSLYSDAKSAGVPDSVILDLIKMYSWNVDFQREIHANDKFEVLYEEYRTEEGKLVHGKGNIIYAKLVLSDRSMPFYRFEGKGGFVDYYDENGRSAKKPLMKTPIDGARLSSGFGMRKHPVMGFSKMHEGLDFAAPTGTPIYAAGDGVIEKMGPFSTYGNYVRLRHRMGLETAYAHMKRFKAGLHAGSRVKQGDVIGYVGTTGRSTGAHLHYEVIVDNIKKNPSSVKLPTGIALGGRELKSFKRVMVQARSKFDTIGKPTAVAESVHQRKKSVKIARN